MSHFTLRHRPESIKSWVDSQFTLNSFWLFRLDEVYETVAIHLLSRPGNVLSKEFRRDSRSTLYPERLQYYSCSTKEMIFGCGFRFESPKIDDLEVPPGQNLWGRIVTKIFKTWLRGHEQSPPMDITSLIDGTLRPPPNDTTRKTILLLTDSMGRQVKAIPAGDVVRIGGGVYGDLAGEIQARNLVLSQYKYIIVVCGTNHCRYMNYELWHRSLDELWACLKPALDVNPNTRIIFNTPIWHPRQRYVVDHGRWVTDKFYGVAGVHMFEWHEPRGNPFVLANRSLRRRLFHHDRFHVCHKGFRVLWDAWCSVFEELRAIDFKFSAGYYEVPLMEFEGIMGLD